MKFIFCLVFVVAATSFLAVADEEPLLRDSRQLTKEDITIVEKPKISYRKLMYCNVEYTIGLKAKYRITIPKTSKVALFRVTTILKDTRGKKKVSGPRAYVIGPGKSVDIDVDVKLKVTYTKEGHVRYRSKTYFIDVTTGKRKLIMKEVDPRIVCT